MEDYMRYKRLIAKKATLECVEILKFQKNYYWFYL